MNCSSLTACRSARSLFKTERWQFSGSWNTTWQVQRYAKHVHSYKEHPWHWKCSLTWSLRQGHPKSKLFEQHSAILVTVAIMQKCSSATFNNQMMKWKITHSHTAQLTGLVHTQTWPWNIDEHHVVGCPASLDTQFSNIWKAPNKKISTNQNHHGGEKQKKQNNYIIIIQQHIQQPFPCNTSQPKKKDTRNQLLIFPFKHFSPNLPATITETGGTIRETCVPRRLRRLRSCFPAPQISPDFDCFWHRWAWRRRWDHIQWGPWVKGYLKEFCFWLQVVVSWIL